MFFAWKNAHVSDARMLLLTMSREALSPANPAIARSMASTPIATAARRRKCSFSTRTSSTASRTLSAASITHPRHASKTRSSRSVLRSRRRRDVPGGRALLRLGVLSQVNAEDAGLATAHRDDLRRHPNRMQAARHAFGLFPRPVRRRRHLSGPAAGDHIDHVPLAADGVHDTVRGGGVRKH